MATTLSVEFALEPPTTPTLRSENALEAPTPPELQSDIAEPSMLPTVRSASAVERPMPPTVRCDDVPEPLMMPMVRAANALALPTSPRLANGPKPPTTPTLRSAHVPDPIGGLVVDAAGTGEREMRETHVQLRGVSVRADDRTRDVEPDEGGDDADSNLATTTTLRSAVPLAPFGTLIVNAARILERETQVQYSNDSVSKDGRTKKDAGSNKREDSAQPDQVTTIPDWIQLISRPFRAEPQSLAAPLSAQPQAAPRLFTAEEDALLIKLRENNALS